MTRAGALVVLGGLLSPVVALGQSAVTVGKASNNEVGFQFTHQVFGRRAGAGTTRLTYRGWARLGIEGVIASPRVADYRFMLQPTLAQVRIQQREDSPDEREEILGLTFSARIFPRGALSGKFNVSRTSGSDRTSTGTERQLRSNTLGAGVSFRNRFLPAEFEYRNESRERLWLDRGTSALENRAVEKILFSASNRKTRVRLERNVSRNRISGGVFSAHRAEVRHTTRWGKGSRSQSSLVYYRGVRSFVGGPVSSLFERFNWSERLHLQHTRSVGSDFGFRRSWGRAAASSTGRVDADAAVRARITRRLSMAIALASRSTDFEGGSASGLSFSPSVAFGFTLPSNGDLSASASAGFDHNRSKPGENSWVAVVDERHVVDASGRFTLNNQMVDVTSVVITSAARSRIFDAGVDYQLAESRPFLDVLVPPGGRIATGDTLLVSYRYQPFPESSDLAFIAAYGVTVYFPSVRVYLRRSLRAGADDPPGLLGSGDVVLASVHNRDEQVVGIGLTQPTPVGSLDVVAERRYIEFGSAYRTTFYDIRGTLGFRLPGDAHGVVGANLSHSKNGDGLVQDVVSLRSSASWIPPVPGLRLEGSFVIWNWVLDGRSSHTMGGVLDVEWRVGRTSVVLQYSRNRWEDDTRRNTLNRLWTYLVRTF